MNTLITRIIFPYHWKIILIISCLKQRKCQYAYLNANIIRCLIWKKTFFQIEPSDFSPDLRFWRFLAWYDLVFYVFSHLSGSLCQFFVDLPCKRPRKWVTSVHWHFLRKFSWPCFASICPPPTLHTLVQYWKTRTISATYQRVFQNFTSVRTTVPRYFLAVVSFRQIPHKLCGIMIL